MSIHQRTLLSLVVIILFGGVLFYLSTDGFRAFTSESARTLDLMENNPPLPPVTLQDSEFRTFDLDEFSEDKYVFMTFMYTNCATVCPQMEMNMAEVYELIPPESIGKDIVFLSISFDPTRDDPETLAKYRTYYGSDGETWRMARAQDQEELDSLLHTLGVIVIPDEYGNFQHNAAFYLVGKTGRLLDVLDFTEIEEAAAAVNAVLAKGGE
ncbi:SCO family protein [Bacillus piscicola]|uniref:SCO family protein n=1 Tax=Bacillus piscicola TaxID=1632684 RepID=UPI001F096434|nr:SCO family protein [Bacillus piscicola]